MTKTTIGLTINSETIRDIKKLGINISGEVEKYLQRIVYSATNDVDKLDLILIDKKLREKQEQKYLIETEIILLQNQKESIRLGMEQKEKERLENEKKAIIEAHKCKECGHEINIEEKHYKFNIGLICSNCYSNKAATKFKVWSAEQ